MKKSTLESIRAYVNGDSTVDLSVLREEINEEYERLTAKSRANATMYEAAIEPIISTLTGANPMTAKEIFTACKDILPEKFTANKVQYLLLHQLADRVVKHENIRSANTYSLKG